MVAATRPPAILLVEDNPGDVRLTVEAMKSWRNPPDLVVATDGAEALAVLGDLETSSGVPDLILLDLNLPGIPGVDVLRALKGSESLRAIPVIVLTSSGTDEDVQSAYDLHANCYVVKPMMLDDYLSLVRAIESFWFTCVRLRPGSSS